MQTLDYDTQPATAEHVSDADITAAIELFFLTKKGVAAHLVDVATHDGIVVLTGITDNLLARERAEEIALAVRGVRGVVNELLISTADVPDEELQRHVATALADDPAASGYDVRGSAADGVVTLTGTVQSWAEKQLVLRVARGVRGVRRLATDELTIQWGEVQNSDEETTTQIRELLDWDIRVHSALVEIRTYDRVVHLAGTVGSAAEKAQVVATAYQAGARRVEARDLFVAYWALTPELRRSKYASRTDSEISQAVLDTFRFDPRVLSYQPTVLVHHGIVTLSGAVSNLRAKQDAERDARDVVGVWDVHNLLKVRTTRFIPDLNIHNSIKEALARDPYLGYFDFSVHVRNGKASLYGQVSSHFEQAQAGAVAAGVNGVSDLENWVSVAASPGFDGFQSPARTPNADFALAERIRRRYFWSASLHNQGVEVAVEKGRATLTGTVDTWLDRDQAAYDAYTAGARYVDNDLLVSTVGGL
ncbi:BON domain-containing protein [Hymenobacter sp.]|uniref:BON domain-containing protein n=1 Tax=Hymenobacter sp. TaxID=1898978 RepID=UPI002869FAB4|nr:BON domain-containing protein [Hymenobacter sp.]